MEKQSKWGRSSIRLLGAFFIVASVILLLNPVFLGFSVSTCGGILIIGLIIMGATLIVV